MKKSVTVKRAKEEIASLHELLSEAVTLLRCYLKPADRPAAWDHQGRDKITENWLTKIATSKEAPANAREWLSLTRIGEDASKEA